MITGCGPSSITQRPLLSRPTVVRFKSPISLAVSLASPCANPDPVSAAASALPACSTWCAICRCSVPKITPPRPAWMMATWLAERRFHGCGFHRRTLRVGRPRRVACEKARMASSSLAPFVVPARCFRRRIDAVWAFAAAKERRVSQTFMGRRSWKRAGSFAANWRRTRRRAGKLRRICRRSDRCSSRRSRAAVPIMRRCT